MNSPTDEVEDWRCSTWSRLEGLDPIGTVGSYAGYLLIEWPLPWPRDLSDIEELKPVCDAARERNIRVQAIASVKPGPGCHVIYYERPALVPGALQQGHDERVVAQADLVETALNMMASPAPIVSGPSKVRDVLICTNGSRDRCCGKLGARLALDASDLVDRDAGVRVWRTSHTGGHRFAPTMVILPEATGWAYVEPQALAQIVNRREPAARVSRHYRGTAWLDNGPAQTLDRTVLERLGWMLLGMPRWSATDLPADQVDAAAPESETQMNTLLTVSMPSGEVHTWAGAVGRREVSLPNCGQPARGTMASFDEYRMISMRDLTRSSS